ncbi:MAG: hypothetical protein D8B60_10960 [Moraxella sp.]|jgi:hypothetical protein|nr:MAG: hypothetical protein D8B60_10960 [Moraxella sp.]
MAKKKNEDGSGFGLIVLIVGVIICYSWDFLVRNRLFLSIGFVVCLLTILHFRRKSKEKKRAEMERRRIERFNYLYSKYVDEDIVVSIMNQEFWQGQTEEMLLDSLGYPDDKDIKVLKSKRREVWKYDKISARSYRTKIILENGIVVGYDY